MGETCDMAPLTLSVLIVKGWSVRVGGGRRGSGEEEEEEERLILRE
jgi:hypothetical protein